MSEPLKVPATEIDIVVTKLAVIWTGTFYGIKVSDMVLLATFVYTILQIGLLLSDRVFKPLWKHYRQPRI